MKILLKLLMSVAVIFVALQFVRPGIPDEPATAELQTPADVKQILRTGCYSCHSNERRLSWFDQVVPAYWLVRHDVLTARENLNFSTLGSQPASAQRGVLYESINMVQLGAMPLPQYIKLHPEAKLTSQDIATLKAYLAPWSSTPPLGASRDYSDERARVNLATVQPEFNGLSFDPTFGSWKLISTTDRGDNNTFRFILGNDVALEAVRSGNISPWPDGARLAKIAWQQESGPDGLIHPGAFIQVELMVKDASRFRTTDGWGWGRWRGLDLKLYGHDAHFVDECTMCHMPVRGNDAVYTLPITTVPIARREVVNNRAATLPSSLPYQPLAWSAITMYVNPKDHTTATLYGNERAMQAAHVNNKTERTAYAPGAVLALVTWAQRDDPHWFGARIPDAPRSIEFLEVGATTTYRKFAGATAGEESTPISLAQERKKFILSLTPVELP